MKTLIQYFFVVLLPLVITCSCNKASVNLSDTKLIGTWRLDSLTNISGGDTKTANMDTSVSSYYKGKHIAVEFKDDFSIYSTNYSFDITGKYTLKSSTSVNISMNEIKNASIVPISLFQPLFVKSMNDASTYRIDGTGAYGSQLFIYYANGQAVIRFTKI